MESAGGFSPRYLGSFVQFSKSWDSPAEDQLKLNILRANSHFPRALLTCQIIVYPTWRNYSNIIVIVHA